MRKALLIGMFGLVVASCVQEEVGELAQGLVACPNFACAQNGSELTTYGLHELSESRQPNSDGYVVGLVTKRQRSYRLKVRGAQLTAESGGHVLAGNDLIGAQFEVRHAERHERYSVRIRGWSLIPIYAGPLVGTLVPQYSLEWAKLENGRPLSYAPLCTGLEGTRSDQLESMLFFEGDRYDRAGKRVLSGDDDWFNVACTTDVLGKLFLTGQTTFSGGSKPPSRGQQQAVLKALVADYCGDGHSFTVDGEPLYWKTSDGSMRFAGEPSSLEARWSADGAECLGQPRLVSSEAPEVAELFPMAADGTPGILAAIAERCALPPSCAEPRAFGFFGEHVVTANP